MSENDQSTNNQKSRKKSKKGTENTEEKSNPPIFELSCFIVTEDKTDPVNYVNVVCKLCVEEYENSKKKNKKEPGFLTIPKKDSSNLNKHLRVRCSTKFY